MKAMAQFMSFSRHEYRGDQPQALHKNRHVLSCWEGSFQQVTEV